MTDTMRGPASRVKSPHSGGIGAEGDIERSLRETARSLLEEGRVDLIIGYERGSVPLRTTPCFVRTPEDAKRLVWNACCENNLAVYLRNREGRVAVVAKGCDVRAIVGLATERQVRRDSVFVIGVPCEGLIDRRKIESWLGESGWCSPVEILGATLEDRKIVLTGEAADERRFEERLPQEAFLYEVCLTCEQRTPLLCDVLIGNPAPPSELADPFSDVRALEASSAGERWLHFSQEFENCIRCYACRQACPLCYCQECFIDQTQPRWFGKTDDLSDTVIFHIVRALHVAGRCVDCGACSRACPMGIDLQALNRKMMKDVREWYGYQAGMDPEAIPPLATFRPDDPQEFIR